MEGAKEVKNMTINYHRTGGFPPPTDHEYLKIQADGSFVMWRSMGKATFPPTPVGRFSGKLSPQDNLKLQKIAQETIKEGGIILTLSPDSALERIQVDGTESIMGIHSMPDGKWGELMQHIRPLLSQLTKYPEAAVGVELTDQGSGAKLVRYGSGILHIDLSHLFLRAVLWENMEPIDSWEKLVHDFGNMTNLLTEQNWTIGLPFEHGFTLQKEHHVAVYVYFVAFDGESPTDVSVETF